MSRGKDDPDFASRWSRLKREARAPAPQEAPEAEAAAEAPVEDMRSDSEVLEELGLPDPDSLKPGDDFAAFMAKVVPARIRNRALRRLWLSDPVLANVDMLVDYGDDFTDAATVVENLQTAYQVGKGFVDRVAGIAGEAPGEAPGDAPAETPGEAPEETGEEKAAETADEPAPAEIAEDPPDHAAAGETVADHAPGEPETAPDPAAVLRKPLPPRRRMRFRVAEE